MSDVIFLFGVSELSFDLINSPSLSRETAIDDVNLLSGASGL